MIKSAKTVISRLAKGHEMQRGTFGAWSITSGKIVEARVHPTAALEAIQSGLLARADGRESVVAQTWVIASKPC